MTIKADQGKLRYHLLPPRALRLVVQVLEFGANKYAEDNWRTVRDWRKRYTSAAMRHLEAYRMGEDRDPETGLPHLAHLACCVLFLLDLEAHPTQVAFRGDADRVARELEDERRRFQEREDFKAKLRGVPTEDERRKEAARVGGFLGYVASRSDDKPDAAPCVWGETHQKSTEHRAREVKEGPGPGGPYRTPLTFQDMCTCAQEHGVPAWVLVSDCPVHGRDQGSFHTASGEILDTLGAVFAGLPRPKDPQGKPFSDREYRKAITDLLTMRHG